MAALRDGVAFLLGWALRLPFIAAGLVFAASLLVAMLGLLAFWFLRIGWARLTGRPTVPWTMRVDPRAGWQRMYRAGENASGLRRRAPVPADVTDVEPK